MPHAPLTDDQQARDKRGRRMSPAAIAVTASIAAGSLGLATYAATAGAGTSQSADSQETLRASVGQFSPTVAADAVAALSDTAAEESTGMFAQMKQMREDQAAALGVSTGVRDESLQTVQDQAERISQERAEEKRAAAEKAAREAAEKAAAEQAAAEAAAAEQAAAEAAAAERAAAERAEQEQAASRSQERAAQPEPQAQAQPEPQPQPEPEPAPVYSGDARGIAQSMLGSYGWGMDQWGCLDSLWQKESGWNHTAMNASSGAYGIPQSLPGSKMATAGADWQTNPATQIEWGLGYISGRYGSPCAAWAHSQAVNWY
ncbi:lytic transglycosylase domain-containing protein [uncultured Serinicoccus sp.]|uniref:aggregation-promoting factor C-terminal-like domain-containing protein n=1 Tax=uncultured Serinicoccus sp. TaxID=735514 RepID=UPI00262F0534|nr:lytic transglycosylase domain-containing protein [uncultured Serinicoccus sp.]